MAVYRTVIEVDLPLEFCFDYTDKQLGELGHQIEAALWTVRSKLKKVNKDLFMVTIDIDDWVVQNVDHVHDILEQEGMI